MFRFDKVMITLKETKNQNTLKANYEEEIYYGKVQ